MNRPLGPSPTTGSAAAPIGIVGTGDVGLVTAVALADLGERMITTVRSAHGCTTARRT